MGYALVLFFQAEVGMRDLTVTGVQTCALPISIVTELAHSFLYNTITTAGRHRDGLGADVSLITGLLITILGPTGYLVGPHHGGETVTDDRRFLDPVIVFNLAPGVDVGLFLKDAV